MGRLSVVMSTIFLFCCMPLLLGQANNVQQLINALNGPQRLPAIIALGKLGPGAEPALAEMLRVWHDPGCTEIERRELIATFGKMGECAWPAVPSLCDALSKHPVYRREVMHAMSLIGEKAVKPLLVLLTQTNPDPELISGLADFGGKAKSARRHLLTRLDDPNQEVRLESALALCHIVPGEDDLQEAVPILRHALRDSRYDIRLRAVLAMAGLGDKAGVLLPQLLALFKDAYWPIRRHASQAVSRLGVQSLPRVREIFNDPGQLLWLDTDSDRLTGHIRFAAALVLADSSAPEQTVCDILAQGLASDQPAIREVAGEKLSRLGRPATVVRYLAAGDWQTRIAAIQTLEAMGENAGATAIVELRRMVVSDTDETVRATCAHALTRLHAHDDATLVALSQALADRRWLYRETAARALRELSGGNVRKALPLLVDNLADNTLDVAIRRNLFACVQQTADQALSESAASEPVSRLEMMKVTLRACDVLARITEEEKDTDIRNLAKNLYTVLITRLQYSMNQWQEQCSPLVRLEVQPARIECQESEKVRLTVVGIDQNGREREVQVGWQAKYGQMAQNDYTAPEQRSEDEITALVLPERKVQSSVRVAVTLIPRCQAGNCKTRQAPGSDFCPQHKCEIDTDVWQVCWNKSGQYFDFTPDIWVNLPHDKQFEYAKAYQAWYAKIKGLPIEKTVSGMAMRLIPPGKFWMGAPYGESDRASDEARHQVLISKPYYIGKTEVTQAQWKAVKEYPTSNSPCFKEAGTDAPMERISWEDCQKFCSQAGVKMPSEAQWEYACRAGTMRPFNLGENITPSQVNYDGNNPYKDAAKGEYRQKTVPVASLPNQNAWGCYDFHGNVWEWCQDWYHDSYNGAPTDGGAWETPTGSFRVVRGGSWYNFAGYLRSATRGGGDPSYRYHNFGLRSFLAK